VLKGVHLNRHFLKSSTFLSHFYRIIQMDKTVLKTNWNIFWKN